MSSSTQHAVLRIFLREELRAVLREEAVSVRAADVHGLALLVDDGMYVLYDADAAITTMLELPGESGTTLSRALHGAGVVLAMLNAVKTPHCWDVRTVTSAAAVKGYGPLLYDIAMSDGALAPDRQSVSLSAERVWQRYHARADVTKEPLGKGCKKHVSARPWLNFAYSLTSPVDSSLLRARHAQVVAELSYDFSQADVSEAIKNAANRYFDSRYVEA